MGVVASIRVIDIGNGVDDHGDQRVLGGTLVEHRDKGPQGIRGLVLGHGGRVWQHKVVDKALECSSPEIRVHCGGDGHLTQVDGWGSHVGRCILARIVGRSAGRVHTSARGARVVERGRGGFIAWRRLDIGVVVVVVVAVVAVGGVGRRGALVRLGALAP